MKGIVSHYHGITNHWCKRIALLLCIGVLFSCTQDTGDQQLKFASSAQAIPSTSESTPIGVTINFQTSVPVKAKFVITTGDSSWEYQNTSYQRFWSEQLLFFVAGASHNIDIYLEDGQGRKLSRKGLTYTAPKLPAGDLSPSITFSSGAGLEAAEQPNSIREGNGYHGKIRFYSLFRYHWGAQNEPSDESGYSLVVGVNQKNNIVWFHQSQVRIESIESENSGKLTLISKHSRKLISLWGDTLSQFRGNTQTTAGDSILVDADSLNRGLVTLDNGNKLLLVSNYKITADHPLAIFNPSSAVPNKAIVAVEKNPVLTADSVIEMSADGVIVKQWDLLALLDSKRSTYLSHSAVNTPNNAVTLQWGGAKSLDYDKETGLMIIGLANQDAVVAIDKTTSQLKWILGDPNGWSKPWADLVLKPVSSVNGEAVIWPYAPATVKFVDKNTIFVLDSGGYRAIPPDYPVPPEQSVPRLVLYQIDSVGRTVSQLASQIVDVSGVAKKVISQRNVNWHWQNSLAADLGREEVFLGSSYLDGFAQIKTFNWNTASWQDLLALTSSPGSDYHWGVAGIVVDEELVGRELVSASAKINDFNAAVPDKDEIDTRFLDSSIAHYSVNSFKLAAKPAAATEDFSGSWQLVVGEDSNTSQTLNLALSQKQSIASGQLDGEHLVAWVKGNTLSFTLHRKSKLGRLRYRYQGAVNDLGDLQGIVVVKRNNKYIGSTQWSGLRVP